MLELLVTVTLNAFKQSGQGKLLLVTQFRLLLLDYRLHLGFKFVALELLEKVGLHFDLLGLLVSLHTNELGLFIA